MKTKEIATFRKSYKDYDKQCYFEGFKLAVMFDEKDAVKKWGARWNQDGKFWWMPADCLTTDVHDGIGTVRDWLNDHKMIVGQYGKFNENEHTLNLFHSENGSNEYTEYNLIRSAYEQFKVQFYFKEDVAKFIHGEMATEYYTIEDGRERWDEFIANGYNRVENS